MYALMTSVSAARLPAQLAAEPSRGVSWMERWSPLRGLMERSETLAVPVDELGLPVSLRRSGAFWWAGNPAALRRDIEGSRNEYAIGLTDVRGGYRRPLDPTHRESRWGSVLGWLPSGDRSALFGRAYASRERDSPGSGSSSVNPYTPGPFVTLDTMRSDVARTRFWLDGAASVELGKWSVGMGLGLETSEHQSVASPLVRRTRQSMPGISLGVTRKIGSIQLGPYASWRSRSETIVIIERAAEGLVVELAGLHETPPLSISQSYRRRTREDLPSAGLSLTHVSHTGEWTVFAERSMLHERLTRHESNDPIWDHWRVDAFSTGAAWSRSGAQRGQLAAAISYTRHRGNGDLGLDTSGVIHRATRSDLDISAEWRLPGDSLGWQVALGARSVIASQVRTEPTIPISATIRAATHSARADIGGLFANRIQAAVSVVGTAYFAQSSFPGPFGFQDTYRAYVLPELDRASRPAHMLASSLSLRWMKDAEAAMWLRLGFARLSPTEAAPTVFGPTGSRRRLELLFGITLDGNS